MQDSLTRGLLTDRHIRVAWASTTELARETVRIHGLGPATAHVMCRGMTGGILLSTLLDDGERYGIQWRYTGAIGNLFVDVNDQAEVRGTVSTPVLGDEVRTEDDVYGQGGQVVIVKSRDGQRLSAGTTDAPFCEVIGDLGFFFCVSDQVETAIRVLIQLSPDPAEPVVLCHGIMLQAMPGCDLEYFGHLADDLRSPQLNRLLDHAQVADNTIERLLQALQGGAYNGAALELFDCPAPVYRCRCSRSRTLNALRAFPPEDLRSIISNREETVITCEFCRTRQVFQPEDLQILLEPDGGTA
jgi:molecular chaperone Hsp33